MKPDDSAHFCDIDPDRSGPRWLKALSTLPAFWQGSVAEKRREIGVKSFGLAGAARTQRTGNSNEAAPGVDPARPKGTKRVEP